MSSVGDTAKNIDFQGEPPLLEGKFDTLKLLLCLNHLHELSCHLRVDEDDRKETTNIISSGKERKAQNIKILAILMRRKAGLVINTMINH